MMDVDATLVALSPSAQEATWAGRRSWKSVRIGSHESGSARQREEMHGAHSSSPQPAGHVASSSSSGPAVAPGTSNSSTASALAGPSVTAATAAALTANAAASKEQQPIVSPVNSGTARGEARSQQPQQGGKVQEAVDHEVSSSELLKWSEMIDAGISQYMQQHPDRFHRRVRRGIPPKFRWEVWKAAVRVNDYELPKDYHSLSREDNKWTALIEIDIARTFPELKASFDSKQQQRLLRVLNAYAAYNPSVGYCQGMNFVAGLLLLVSDCEEESFQLLTCLMDHVGLGGFYSTGLPLLKKYLAACDNLVKESVPELRLHFEKENIQAAVYLHQWFLTLFINCFPLSMVLIIWDVIVCEGLPVILRIAVSILQVLKDSLLSMHFEEIIKFFKMMKTYEDEDGELNAFRIGQLLMKHTEHVVIPDRVMEYLTRDHGADDPDADPDDPWGEADLNGNSWLQSFSFSRMFNFGSSRRGSRALDGRGSAGSSYAASSSAGGRGTSEASQHHRGAPSTSDSAHGSARAAPPTATSGAVAAAAAAADRGGYGGGQQQHSGGGGRGSSQGQSAGHPQAAEDDRGWEFL